MWERVPADGMAVEGAPAGGVAVDWPADGVAVEIGEASVTRERRLRRRAFSIVGKSHTGTGTMGGGKKEERNCVGGSKETRCHVRRGSDRGNTTSIYMVSVCQHPSDCPSGLSPPSVHTHICPTLALARDITRGRTCASLGITRPTTPRCCCRGSAICPRVKVRAGP